MTDEDRIRRALAPYIFDGTEAVEKILLVLNSPARPPDLRRAIGSILCNTYRDTVHVDVVLDVLLKEIEPGGAA
jgi:hypothetical protein